LEERGERKGARITVVSPTAPGLEFGDNNVASAIRSALDRHGIELVSHFPIERVTFSEAYNSLGQSIRFNLLMLLPPFHGASAVSHLGITNKDGYIEVAPTMQVTGLEGVYAVGDCVNFSGPKMGHMAVRQGAVAAANLVAEINGREPVSHYVHDMKLVVDEGGSDSIYVHKDVWADEPANVRQGRFWTWAKRVQERYWEAAHL
jgi:sulfide:quinone oxidoreductase